jgi:hypothetical protein
VHVWPVLTEVYLLRRACSCPEIVWRRGGWQLVPLTAFGHGLGGHAAAVPVPAAPPPRIGAVPGAALEPPVAALGATSTFRWAGSGG